METRVFAEIERYQPDKHVHVPVTTTTSARLGCVPPVAPVFPYKEITEWTHLSTRRRVTSFQ